MIMDKSDTSIEKRLALGQRMIETCKLSRIPPADFNPLTAEDKELIHYGYPPKPDEKRQPALRVEWEKRLSKPFKVIVPELKVLDRPLLRVINGPAWSGAVLTRQPGGGEIFQTIQATWTVPSAYPAVYPEDNTGSPDDQWWSATWIGLDGIKPDFSADSLPLIQMGTFSNVSQSGGALKPDTFAFFEWFPAAYIRLQDVTPGDTVTATLCVHPKDGTTNPSPPTTVTAFFVNESQNTAYSTKFYDPNTDMPFQGLTAEWITEDPLSATDVHYKFPDYGNVVFTDCKATTNITSETALDFSDSSLAIEQLVTADGNPKSTATIMGTNAVQTRYGDWTPWPI